MKSPYQRTAREWISFCDENITAGPTTARRNISFPGQGIRKANCVRELLDIPIGSRVVDIGCGNGRIPIGFTMDDFHVRYTGISIIEGCVDFCRKAFEGAEEFFFYYVDVRNPRYNPNGMIEPDEVVYPIDDSYADFVLFSSIFTHIGEVSAVHKMLSEARRMLREGGICYCTWFLSPPNKISTEPIRIVHPKNVYEELISGWHLVGEHSGTTTGRHDQRLTVLKKY